MYLWIMNSLWFNFVLMLMLTFRNRPDQMLKGWESEVLGVDLFLVNFGQGFKEGGRFQPG